MKKLLTIILTFISLYASAQRVEDSILIPHDADGDTYPCLVYKPLRYTTAIKYGVLIFGHGAGESTPPLSTIYNSTTAGGPPYFIEHAAWPDSFLNQKDGKYYQLIVVTPQAANTGWGIGANQIPYFLAYLKANYSIDTTRIYFTGLSAGGEGEAEYLYHLGVTPTYLPAFSVLASEAGDNPNGTGWGAIMANDKDTLAGWGDSAADIHGQFTELLMDNVNEVAPNSAQYFNVVTGGHGPWNAQYNPTWTFAFTIPGHTYTQNIYREMLTFQRGVSSATPTANAGTDQTITLPTSSVTLDGSGSGGTISSYTWTQLSGPNTASLATPSAVTCVASSMIAGTYKFKLSLNAGVSTDSVLITVNPAGTYPSCGSRTKYTMGTSSVGFAAGDTAFFYDASVSTTYKPGDTLVFGNSTPIPRWVYIELDNFKGNPSCPLVITYTGTQCLVENLAGDTTNGHNGTINLVSDNYVKVDGNKGVAGTYGFLIQGDPVLRYDLGAGLQNVGVATDVECVGIKVRNIGTALWMKNNGDCNLADNYPNPGVDSAFIHNCLFVGTWNEGGYIGNTSPDNAPSGACAYDQRPITCADTTFYPVPPRIGDLYIYNNIFDSTGRGGIQIAGASVGTSYVYGNTVTHNGINGDDAQGTAISTGTYSKVIIHDNICRSTYTWGIALLGASHTGFAQQIYNNTVDSSGFQKWYNLSTTSRVVINPFTEPTFTDTLIWPQSIFVDTKPTCNPVDSTIVWIKNNTLKLCKRPSQQICIQNDFSTLQYHGGNIICGNVTATGGTPSVFIDPTATGFTYINTCSVSQISNIPRGWRIRIR